MSYMHIENIYKNKEILLFKRCYALEKAHGCLHEKTTIKCKDGSKHIKDVNVGDIVFSYNEKNKKFELHRVQKTIVQPPDGKWLCITLMNGKDIMITEEHKVLTQRGWIEARNLNKDDELISWTQ